MNRALQPEIHPDAESLSAFIELALPQPERAHILEHVAGCSQCRQVIFLSQQAATDADAQATVPSSSRPDAWYRNWHLNWRLAWAPELAAFALIVILVVAHYVRQTPKQTQMARATPPAPVVALAPQEPTNEAQVSRLAPHAGLKAAKKSPPAVPEPASEIASSSASYGGVASEAGGAGQGYAPSAQAMPAPGGFGQGYPANATAVEKPAPAVAAWEQQKIAADQLSTAAREARTTQARFRANAADAQGGRSMAPAAAPAIQAKATVTGSFDAAPSRSMTYAVALPKAEASILPSGLAAVSIATAQHRTVAIDPQGTLFVRENSLANWEPVFRQWTGHAVRVRLKQLPEGSVAVDAGVQSAAPAFEIVNDSNQVWVSQDGKTWKAE